MASDRSGSADELKQMRRVTDLSLTGHSWLRDRYRRRYTGLLGLILGLSLASSTLAFVSSDTTWRLGSMDLDAKVLAGALTLIIFFVALVDLLVDWRHKSWQHALAADRFAALKQRFRTADMDRSPFEDASAELRSAYVETTALPPQLPERLFLPIKARHLRKVEISQYMDSHKGGSVWVARLVVWWKGNLDSQKRRRRGSGGDANRDASKLSRDSSNGDNKGARHDAEHGRGA